MLRTRLLTAAILLPAVAALVLYAPPWLFTIVNVIAGLWGLYEVAEMTGALHWVAIPLFAVVGGIPLFALLYGGNLGWVGWVVPLDRDPDDARAGRANRSSRRRRKIPRTAPRLHRRRVRRISIPVLLAGAQSARAASTILLLVILLAVVSDSGAYFVGRYMGRTKLAPSVSPNKTVEGAVGGLVATVVGGWLLFKMIGGTWDMGRILLFAAMISILAQLGDLAGSALKRAAGVKDSGWIFPGHGGLLDRTCSLVFALFFTYYWFQ